MGTMLPKPVMATVVEQKSLAGSFCVGLAEINGWRRNMEDAHVIHCTPDWGFFGIFDGHGGDACSSYVSAQIQHQLEHRGCPEDDEELRRRVFEIDESFLKSGKSSGTTGAMCIVHRPSEPGGRVRLRVANVGDSRVLLGTRDGNIIDGGGTDKGLTTDHKPSSASEKMRIYRCGGFVVSGVGGVARVNGDLAVSRAFGDADYKKTGGPGLADRPVTSDPEFGDFECSESDFLVIVCDGISEGNFSNSEVVELVAQHLREGDHPAVAAKHACWKAEATNSKDNCSCMIVLFSGDHGDERTVEFAPGPFCKDANFVNAFEAMASRAGLTLAEAVEMRYDEVSSALLSEDDMSLAIRDDMKKELAAIGEPPGDTGSTERKQWFEEQTWGVKGLPMGSRCSTLSKPESPDASPSSGSYQKSKSCALS